MLGKSKSQNITIPVRDDFQKYFTQYNVIGTFAVVDEKNNILTLSNPSKLAR
jgi:hypothetical protein